MLTVPVSRSEFIGRDEVLNLLNKRVKAFKKGYRQNIVLLGPEMIGKTSILSQFISYLEEEQDILPVYISLMEEPFSHFAGRFMSALLYYTLKKKRIPSKGRYSVDLQSLKNEIRPLCPKVVESIHKIEKLLEYKRSTQAFSALFDLVPVLKEEVNIPVLLVIDEFHFIMSMNIKRPYLLLGEHIMSQKDVMYVITSSEVELGKEILSHDLSLLFGNFEQVMVSSFDYTSSREFLNQRLKWINIKPVHKKFLISVTGGHPFYMEILTRRLRSIVQEYKVGQVPRSILVKAITEEVLIPSSFIYQYIENFLQRLLNGPSKWTYMAILLSICSGRKKIRDIAKDLHLSATPVARNLKRLVDMGVIRKCGNMYIVTEPMLSLWLRLAYRKLITSLDIDYSVYEEEIRKDLEREIDIFEEEETKTLAERLRTLFSYFKNEVVSLNGHRFKLPHFSEVEHRVVKGIDLPIVARVHNRYWIPQIAEKKITQKDIEEIIEKFKKLHYRVSCKPLICLEGIDRDAKLAAQEAGLSIWELEDVNTLLNIYNQCPIVT